MGHLVYISDVNINETSEHNAFLRHKTIGLSNDSYDFQIFSQVIKNAMPWQFSKLGIESFYLSRDDIKQLGIVLKNELLELIKDEQQYPDGTYGDIRKILGKNIRVHLKDQKGKIISSLAEISEIAESCLQNNGVMYFCIGDKEST